MAEAEETTTGIVLRVAEREHTLPRALYQAVPPPLFPPRDEMMRAIGEFGRGVSPVSLELVPSGAAMLALDAQ